MAVIFKQINNFLCVLRFIDKNKKSLTRILWNILLAYFHYKEKTTLLFKIYQSLIF